MGGLRRAVNPIIVDNIAFLFDCRTHPRSISENWCLFVDVCCRSCLFLIFSSSSSSSSIPLLPPPLPPHPPPVLPRKVYISLLWPLLGNIIYIIVSLLLYYYQTVKKTGPGCSKLTMSLVKVSLQLCSLNMVYTLIFLLKTNVSSFSYSHFFSKNT